jgi:hypothetical protein
MFYFEGIQGLLRLTKEINRDKAEEDYDKYSRRFKGSRSRHHCWMLGQDLVGESGSIAISFITRRAIRDLLRVQGNSFPQTGKLNYDLLVNADLKSGRGGPGLQQQ